MIVLHVSVLNNRVVVWSENERIGDWACLQTAIRAIELNLSIGDRADKKLGVWLPWHGDTAIPSSPLIDRPIDKRKKIKLACHRIQVKTLSAVQVLTLVSLVQKGSRAGSGIVFGTSLDWLSRLCSTSLHIIAKENMIPAIVPDQNAWAARWLPVTDATDEKELSNLATTMPAVCRGISWKTF